MRWKLIGGTAALVGVMACGQAPAPANGHTPIHIDGSGTVFPLSAAVAREFGRVHPNVPITLNVSNTGGGFEKFCQGESDIAGAARPIRRPEIEACQRAAVRFIELPVAYDGIVIVAHPEAGWIDHLTVDELRRLWSPEAQGALTRWSQLRQGWPDREFRLFGDAVGSGTYDYFTMATVGREGVSRQDFIPVPDEAALVREVAANPNALGFMTFASYHANRDRLKVIAIDADNAAAEPPRLPTWETIINGVYQPLSRPVFIYVWEQSLQRPEVDQFVRLFLTQGPRLAEGAGLAALRADAYQVVDERLRARWTGTMFGEGGSQVGLGQEQLLRMARVP